MEILLCHGVDEGLHARQGLLNTVDRRSQLVINGSKHDLRVFLHHKLSLQLLLGVRICEHENNLLLAARAVRFDSNVVVLSVHVGASHLVGGFVFLVFQNFLRLVDVELCVFVSLTSLGETLSHLEHDRFFARNSDHGGQKQVFLDFDESVIDLGHDVDELLQRRQNRTTLNVQAHHVFNVRRVFRRLALQNFPGLLVHILDVLV